MINKLNKAAEKLAFSKCDECDPYLLYEAAGELERLRTALRDIRALTVRGSAKTGWVYRIADEALALSKDGEETSIPSDREV